MELDVISKNPKLYAGKEFPEGFVQQLERAKKDITSYVSYCEVEFMSRDSLSHWRDSLNCSWETLRKFFKLFNTNFDPISFIRSEKFTKQERYLFFTYFSCGLRIENSRTELDLNLIDTQSIFDFLTLRKESYGYAFFFYNNLFPEDYAYEDMEYEPYTDQVPMYLEAVEFGDYTGQNINRDRQMKLAFNIDDDKEKFDIKIPGEIDDPVMKLSLKTMKPASGIFLGRLKLGTNSNEHYNIRIDFFKHGHKPILEIKICNRNCLARITDEKLILRLIKLCNMSSSKFIKNQIKSLVRVNRKLSGEFCDLMLNKSIKIYNHKNQDYIHLML